MSEADECTHGLKPEWCSICKHGPRVNKPEAIAYRFTARYDGQCSECNFPIGVGERAAKTTENRVIHGRCIPKGMTDES